MSAWKWLDIVLTFLAAFVFFRAGLHGRGGYNLLLALFLFISGVSHLFAWREEE